MKPFAARRDHRPPSTPHQRLKSTLLGHSPSHSERLFLLHCGHLPNSKVRSCEHLFLRLLLDARHELGWVIDAVARLAAPEPLRVRLGIASGLVVVGDLIGEGAAQERGVVGETPNLAARLQALAGPGTLVLAESTRRQIGGLFELLDLGPQPIAGFAELQRVWHVVRESGVVSRKRVGRARIVTGHP